jgi:hypothetical protein
VKRLVAVVQGTPAAVVAEWRRLAAASVLALAAVCVAGAAQGQIPPPRRDCYTLWEHVPGDPPTGQPDAGMVWSLCPELRWDEIAYPPPLPRPKKLQERAVYLKKNSTGIVKQLALAAALLPPETLAAQARGGIWLLRIINGRAPTADRGPAGRRYSGSEIREYLLRTLDSPRALPFWPHRATIAAIPESEYDQLALAHFIARQAWYEAGGN